ncbi:MCE family protein [bacterium]|nr:MCE family protein [bacterium]
MPSPQVKAFWVGTFVVVGVAIAIGLLIYFGIANWFQKTNTYVTYYEESVQGLILDAEVKFRGVNVGRVTSIEVAPDNTLIEVTMDLETDFSVHDSMRASLALTGITGMRYIAVDYAGPERARLHPELGFEPPHPVLPAAPGSFEELQSAVRDIYDKFMLIDTEGISYRTKKFLDTGTRTLEHVDSVFTQPELTEWSVKLSDNLDLMEELLYQLDTERYAQQIDSTLIDFREGAAHFNSTLAVLEEDVQGLRADEKADSLFNVLNALLQTSTELVNQSQYSTSQVILQLGSTIEEINATLEQMNSLMMSLEAYPANILNTKPPKEEK